MSNVLLIQLLFFILVNCSESEKANDSKQEINKRNLRKGKYYEFIDKLKTQSFKNVVFMTGAGTSTSAGIPDFRSDDGLFYQLQKKYNFSSPREFFEIETFLKSPQYFYDFSKSFNTTQYSPTIFHYFMGFMNSKKMLKYLFTQNIDGLDLKCGIDEDKVIFAHGNFLEAECPVCHKPVDINLYNEHIEKQEILYCDKCGSPVKSKIVFYGESLSDLFFEKSFEVPEADLVIICGASLEVAPFNKLAYAYVNENAFRIVINKIRVGKRFVMRGFEYENENSKDIFLTGTCDEVVQMIAEDVGWTNEFNEYIQNFKKTEN